MNATNLFFSPTAEALGWTLIHALWQGFALALTAALLMHLTRQGRAVVRYQIGIAGLLIQVLASAFTFGMYYEPHALPVSGVVGQSVFSTALLTQTHESWWVSGQTFLNAHLAEIVWTWLVGVGVFGVRLVGGWVYVQRLRRTATLPVPVTLTQTADRIARQLNVTAHVQLSSRVTGPMVVGVLKPVVLWPVGLLAGLSVVDVEAILAHELAHVRRHDYLLNVLQSVVEVLYFFHPALWWLSARVREEREHCCDDVAVQITGDARVLARALTRVEEWQRETAEAPLLAVAFASRRQLLLQRVRRMLGVQTRPLVSNGSLAGLTLATMLLLSVSVYAVHRAEEPNPKPGSLPSVVDNQVWAIVQKRDELTHIVDSLQSLQTNRRHTVDRDSEYGMTNGGQLTYVVWKGQKLPVARVARLQNQLARVMNGQLNPSAIKQPDRAILLTIFEKNVAFDAGMKALSEGMAQINYTNISQVSGAQNAPELRIDSTRVDGDTTRLSAAQRQLEALTKRLQEVMAERQPIIDRLSKEIAELTTKNSGWQREAAQFSKLQADLARQQAALARQQTEMARKMAPLEKQMEALANQQTAQAKGLLRQKELQHQRFEKEMDRLGEQMGKLGGQMGNMDERLEKLQPVQERINRLADSISRLVEPTYEISEKIGELSGQIAEDANKQAEKAMRMAEDAMRAMELNEDRPARAHRPPSPARPARPARPTAPLRATPPRALRPAAPAPPDDIDPVIAPVPTPHAAPVPRVAPAPAQAPRATSPRRGKGTREPVPAKAPQN